jgi:hypothetical protein
MSKLDNGMEIAALCGALSVLLNAIDMNDNEDIVPALRLLSDTLVAKLYGHPRPGQVITFPDGTSISRIPFSTGKAPGA